LNQFGIRGTTMDEMVTQPNSEIATKGDERRLTQAEFQNLADVPPEAEWFANIPNENTKRAYRSDVTEFFSFVGITESADFKLVKRAHLIAWRKELESRALEPASVRRKLSAVASLFDFLCEANAVPTNPVDGVKRPGQGANEGTSPALGDVEAKECWMPHLRIH